MCENHHNKPNLALTAVPVVSWVLSYDIRNLAAELDSWISLRITKGVRNVDQVDNVIFNVANNDRMRAASQDSKNLYSSEQKKYR